MQILITIRRPNGETEVVDVYPKFTGMNEAMFLKIAKATKDGGRGECLGWEIVVAEPVISEQQAGVAAMCRHQDRMAKTMARD